MSTDMTWQTDSNSSKDTEKLGEHVGRALKGGETIELVSDLGGGKTTFVRGLARGIGSAHHVSSPTFTISKVYGGKKIQLHHFDFYRLTDGRHIAHELAEVINDPKTSVVIEWANVVNKALPAKRLRVLITNLGDDKRRLTFDYPKSLAFTVEGLK